MRYLKPEFWTDKNMVRLSPYARLLYMGCWNFAICEEGHLPDEAFELKLQILPVDDVDAEALIEELVALDRLRRVVTPDGRRWLHAWKLGDHQKTDKRWGTRCPVCSSRTANTPLEAAPCVTTPEPAEPPHTTSVLALPLPATPDHTETLPNSPREGIGEEGIGTTGVASGEREETSRKPRARDPIWDAVTAACKVDTTSMTDSARKACNNAVAEFRRTRASPEEIHRRAESFRRHWPNITLTPSALARRWSEVAQPPPTPAARVGAPDAHSRLWGQTQRGAAS